MNAPGSPVTPQALQVRGLHAGYGTRDVLRDVSLDLPFGQWCAVLGPNGSGKSTLLYCVAGLLKPRTGRIELSGTSLERDSAAAKRMLGYASAPERLPGLLTGRQCLEVYTAAKGLRAIDTEVLELAEALAFTPQLDRFVDTYSLGTRQKLATLLALIGTPKLIVLDESFNGLDPASAQLLKHHLRRRVEEGRAAVMLATHSLDIVARNADCVALMLDGQIVKTWSDAELTANGRDADSLETLFARTAAQDSGLTR